MSADRKKRMLVVCHDEKYFQLHRWHILKAVKQEFYITLVLPFRVELDCDVVDLRIKGGSIDVVADFFSVLRLVSVYRKVQPDIIYAISTKTIFLTLIARFLAFGLSNKFPRYIGTFAGLGRWGGFADHPSLLNRIILYLFKKVSHLGIVDFTFETPVDLARVRERFDFESRSLHLILGTGVDFAKFEQSARKHDTKLKILFAGRLLRSKGVIEFIQAAEEIDVLFPGRSEWLIAGWPYKAYDSVSEDELLALLPKNCKYLGFVDDMPSLLQSVDIIVFPSAYAEGIPKALMEAMACSVVPISFQFAGANFLIENGISGFLLSDRSARGIVRQVIDLLEHSCSLRYLKDEAHRRIRSLPVAEADIQASFRLLFQGKPRCS